MQLQIDWPSTDLTAVYSFHHYLYCKYRPGLSKTSSSLSFAAGLNEVLSVFDHRVAVLAHNSTVQTVESYWMLPHPTEDDLIFM